MNDNIKDNYIEEKKYTNQFIENINEIVHQLTELYNNFTFQDFFEKYEIDNKEDFQTKATQEIYERFMYQYLSDYPLSHNAKIGVLAGLSKQKHLIINVKDGEQYYKSLVSRITNYFDNYNKVFDLDKTNKRDNQILEILSFDNNNKYKKILQNVMLYSCFENLDESETNNLINNILNDYYFEVIQPEEDKEIKKKREELTRFDNLIESNKDSIPDLRYVFEGKTYSGFSVANMIRDVGWIPKPSGKNSRKSQERRLAQFIDWNTDKLSKNQSVTTILAIYDSMIAPERKKLYQPFIEILLLNNLYRSKNGTLKTTRSKFFKELGVFPNIYNEVPESYYIDTIPQKYILGETDIKRTYYAFKDSARQKINSLIFPTLKSMEERKLIRYKTNTIIITNANKRVELNKLDEEEYIDTCKKLLAADEYAIEHTYYYDRRKKIYCENWEDIIKHHKQKTFKKIRCDYISEQYGWSYTYEEIVIIAGSKRNIEKSAGQAMNKLKKLLESYFLKNANTKYSNRIKKWDKVADAYKDAYGKSTFTDEEYHFEMEKAKNEIVYLPPHFKDIFSIMIETEITGDAKAVKQYEKWKIDKIEEQQQKKITKIKDKK